MQIGTLLVKVNADIGGLQRGLDRATGNIQRFADGVQRAGARMSILSAAIVAVGVSVTGAAAEMDSLQRGLTAVAGSSKKAQEQLSRLQDVAKLPGLGFREAIRGSISLQAAGLSASLAERSLRAFGNALATVGKGKADLDGVTLALTQIISKGKISSQEINQLSERVPQVRAAMLAAFGTADVEALGKSGLKATDFITRLVDQLNKLPQVTGGAANSFENFSDALFRARAAIGDKLLPAIVPLVEGLANMLVKVRELDPNTVRWAISIAAVTAVVGPLIIGVSSLTSAVVALAAALGVAGLAGTIATGGILLLLGGLSALFVKNKLDALNAAAAADRYKASLIGLSESQLRFLRAQRAIDAAGVAGSLRAANARGNNFTETTEQRSWFEAAKRGDLRGALFPGVQSVQRPTAAMQQLVASAREAGRDIAALDAAIAALGEVKLTPDTPPVTLGKQARDATRDVDGLLQKLEDLAKARGFRVDLLKTSGLPFLPNVPNPQRINPGPLPGADRMALGIGGAVKEVQDFSGALKQAVDTIRSTLSPLEKIKDAGGGQLKAVGDAAINLAAQFTPAGAAAYVLSSALEAIRPFIDALLAPLKILGEIIAIGVVPILRILFPILKAVAIVFAFVQEIINRVLGAILNAVGGFVKGLGKFINAIVPFSNPGTPLVKAGEAIQKTAHNFSEAADEIAKRRKELQGLTFDGALERTSESLNKLTESVLNAVQGFKVQKYRFDAANAAAVPASWSTPTQTVRAGNAASGQSFSVGEVHIHAAQGQDVSVIWRELKALIVQESRRKPGMRQFAAQLG
jgi:tape measure domain-containing protein